MPPSSMSWDASLLIFSLQYSDMLILDQPTNIQIPSKLNFSSSIEIWTEDPSYGCMGSDQCSVSWIRIILVSLNIISDGKFSRLQMVIIPHDIVFTLVWLLLFFSLELLEFLHFNFFSIWDFFNFLAQPGFIDFQMLVWLFPNSIYLLALSLKISSSLVWNSLFDISSYFGLFIFLFHAPLTWIWGHHFISIFHSNFEPCLAEFTIHLMEFEPRIPAWFASALINRLPTR